MKNMKISKAEKISSMDEAFYAGSDSYSHGLKIYLEPAVVEKLDLAKLPEVGAMMGLHAVVEVVEVRLDNAANGGREKSLVLQITDMELQDKSRQAQQQDADPDKTLLG